MFAAGNRAVSRAADVMANHMALRQRGKSRLTGNCFRPPVRNTGRSTADTSAHSSLRLMLRCSPVPSGRIAHRLLFDRSGQYCQGSAFRFPVKRTECFFAHHLKHHGHRSERGTRMMAERTARNWDPVPSADSGSSRQRYSSSHKYPCGCWTDRVGSDCWPGVYLLPSLAPGR